MVRWLALRPLQQGIGQAEWIRRFLATAVRQSLMAIAAFLSLYPLYFMMITAFKSQQDYLINKWGLPHPFVFGNFSTAFQGKSFLVWFTNSLLLTGGSVIASLVIGCLAAFAFAKMDFWGKKAWFNLILSLMVIPPVVMVVPLFISMVNWRLINTYPGAILIYVGLLLPFSIYLVTNFFSTIPREITDAAYMDGCSNLLIFWRIMLPLAGPALITLIVVNALWVWNELLIAIIFLQDDRLKTLMVGLMVFKSRFNLNIPVTMAGLTVATLPMILLYIFGQRYFIRGLTAGAVK